MHWKVLCTPWLLRVLGNPCTPRLLRALEESMQPEVLSMHRQALCTPQPLRVPRVSLHPGAAPCTGGVCAPRSTAMHPTATLCTGTSEPVHALEVPGTPWPLRALGAPSTAGQFCIGVSAHPGASPCRGRLCAPHRCSVHCGGPRPPWPLRAPRDPSQPRARRWAPPGQGWGPGCLTWTCLSTAAQAASLLASSAMVPPSRPRVRARLPAARPARSLPGGRAARAELRSGPSRPGSRMPPRPAPGGLTRTGCRPGPSRLPPASSSSSSAGRLGLVVL